MVKMNTNFPYKINCPARIFFSLNIDYGNDCIISCYRTRTTIPFRVQLKWLWGSLSFTFYFDDVVGGGLVQSFECLIHKSKWITLNHVESVEWFHGSCISILYINSQFRPSIHFIFCCESDGFILHLRPYLSQLGRSTVYATNSTGEEIGVAFKTSYLETVVSSTSFFFLFLIFFY